MYAGIEGDSCRARGDVQIFKVFDVMSVASHKEGLYPIYRLCYCSCHKIRYPDAKQKDFQLDKLILHLPYQRIFRVTGN